ncbi:MAG: SMC-Scp complex subunit ScpB [Acidobacteria bacterium]|nr:MAG: SMC-Scp complex subunit ScpB [Acidobacteriota bacterium]
MIDRDQANLGDSKMLNLKAVIEALLFASHKPLAQKEIQAILNLAAEYAQTVPEAKLAKASEAEIEQTLRSLQQEYNELGRSFQLVEQISGWVLVSRSEFQLWIRQLFPELRPTRLSPPALETLAIIAYRQPIAKADVEAIRGVTIDGVIQKLLDAGLIKIAGRAEVPGRPLLYETTHHFMEHFGLRSLDELPNASELRQITLPKAPAQESHVAENVRSQSQLTLDQEQRGDANSTTEESENGEVQAVTGRDSQAD